MSEQSKSTSIGALGLLLPSLLAMAWLVTRAKWFWNNQPDLEFGWVVLMLCAYLFYEAWEQRPPADFRFRWWVVGAVFAGAGLLLFVQSYWAVFGMHAATVQGLALGLLCLIGANLGLVFGWKGILRFAFPFGFILIALPLPSIIYGPVVSGLQSKVATVNTEILNLMGIPAERVGSLIHLPNGTVGIDEACSGVRSLQSTIMAALFIGYVSLQSNVLRVTLLMLGMGLAVVGNLGRSLYLCLMAHWRGIDSVNKVHDAAGWSVLAFTAAGVIVLAWLINKAERMALAAAEGEAEEGAGAAAESADPATH